MKPSVDVTTYGAVPDDGIDDTAAINAALAAEKAVFFPAGVYDYNGRMNVPDKSIKIYGEGRDVSRIRFRGADSGIYFASAGVETFELTDLSLLASGVGGGGGRTGTAVYCAFSPTPPPNTEKFRMATIERIEIAGTNAQGERHRPSTNALWYWTNGIHLYQASASKVEDVQIHGNFQQSEYGITWESTPRIFATQLFISELYVEYFLTAVHTMGNIHGFYLEQFEFVGCGGYAGFRAAMRLTSQLHLPVFQVSQGHIDFVSDGLQLVGLASAKIDMVDFAHNGAWGVDGTHIVVDHSVGVDITNCGFAGKYLANEVGILAGRGTNGLRVSGCRFAYIAPSSFGGGVMNLWGAANVKVLDTDWGDTRPRTSGPMAIRELP